MFVFTCICVQCSCLFESFNKYELSLLYSSFIATGFKYLGVSLNKMTINSEDIVSKICEGRQTIGCIAHCGEVKIYIWRQNSGLISGLLWM